MTSRVLHIGAVMQPDWDERPLRVIAFDYREVMYDSWRPHDSSWGFASLKGKVSYYRIPYRFLIERSRYVRTDPFSKSEFDAHRPDLPLRLATSDELEWPAVPDVSAFPGRLSSLASSPPVVAGKLYLCPFGPKGATKGSSLVESESSNFTVSELVARAAVLQAPLVTNERPTRGIGLFRLGIENRIPSYYLWGSKSKAETEG